MAPASRKGHGRAVECRWSGKIGAGFSLKLTSCSLPSPVRGGKVPKHLSRDGHSVDDYFGYGVVTENDLVVFSRIRICSDGHGIGHVYFLRGVIAGVSPNKYVVVAGHIQHRGVANSNIPIASHLLVVVANDCTPPSVELVRIRQPRRRQRASGEIGRITRCRDRDDRRPVSLWRPVLRSKTPWVFRLSVVIGAEPEQQSPPHGPRIPLRPSWSAGRSSSPQRARSSYQESDPVPAL